MMPMIECQNSKVAVYACTRNKYEELRVAIHSLQVNNPDVNVIVFAEDDDIGMNVHVINLKGGCEYTDGVNSGSRWTYMTNIRLALTKYLDCDKALYLDIDTIVDDDISELWDLDLSDYYVAGVKEPIKSNESIYVNSGVLLFNLSKLRDGTDEVLLEKIRTESRDFPDQDILNEVLAGHIFELPSTYNANSWTAQIHEPKIVHYAGFEDWKNFIYAVKFLYAKENKNFNYIHRI